MDWHTILIISHIVGTVLGVGGATFAEIFYLKAIKDGEIDPTEGSFLKTTYFILRTGLVLLVLSGFSMLALKVSQGASGYLYNPILWAKLTITIIIATNALLLQAHAIPSWLGFSLSLTSWYAAMILGLWRSLDASYVAIMLFYIVWVLAVGFILERIRVWYIGNSRHTRV